MYAMTLASLMLLTIHYITGADSDTDKNLSRGKFLSM